MKKILSSRRHHYLAIIGIFLIAVVLIGGMVGCVPVSYTLTIDSTDGGWVTLPGEGPFTYDEAQVVNLVATPNAGLCFANWTGDVGTINNVYDASTTITMLGNYSITANFEWCWNDITQVTAGGCHTVGLKSDGRVVAKGLNDEGQCNVGGWTDIIQVAAGGRHTVGLKSDRTVVAVGDNSSGQCAVGDWCDIVQVAAGGSHTVALMSDGSVYAMGDDTHGQCGWEIDLWSNIYQIAAGEFHTVGLTEGGTVVAVGYNGYGQCDVDNWSGQGFGKDIIQIAAGTYHTVGLRFDGTVIATKLSNLALDLGQCNVGGWTDIIQVVAGGVHTVGFKYVLKYGDTVVAVGDNTFGSGPCNVGGWTDIVQLAAGDHHTVGLKSDRTVVAVGDNSCGQCNIGG